ncbi:MAG: OmpA family protein [Magnetococcales bacterium]|nr:OmpA family protein [Magnetococcales bacterium]
MGNIPIGAFMFLSFLALSISPDISFAEDKTTYFQDVPNEVELLQALGKISPKIKYRGIKTRAIVFTDEPPGHAENTPQQPSPSSQEDASIQTSNHEQTPSEGAPAQRKHAGKPQQQASGEARKKVALGLYFNVNSAELTEKARQYADSIGKMLHMKQDLTITLHGHTDATGSDDINIPLSEKRAESVKIYVVNQYHIAPERIAIVGKGATEPLPDTPGTAAINRRVEIVPQ